MRRFRRFAVLKNMTSMRMVFVQKVLYVFIGGNLSVERFSPEPPSKDFNNDLSLTGQIALSGLN